MKTDISDLKEFIDIFTRFALNPQLYESICEIVSEISHTEILIQSSLIPALNYGLTQYSNKFQELVEGLSSI
jgi:hypothetical protein